MTELYKNPFLWKYLVEILPTNHTSGGQERPLTATVAEENPSKLIKTD